MGIDEVKEVLMKEKEKSLRISRIPKRIKASFLALAEEEFENDYGMTLKFLWDKFDEYSYFINNLDTKLDYLISVSKNEKKDESGIKAMSGRVMQGGKK